jgi:hypothetical protein
MTGKPGEATTSKSIDRMQKNEKKKNSGKTAGKTATNSVKNQNFFYIITTFHSSAFYVSQQKLNNC